MKTYKNLYQKIYSFENLLLAAKKAQKGKRFKNGTALFNVNLEKEIYKIQIELSKKTYQPGKYSEFYITEPKPRMISALPYKDRVVHHALCNIIDPIFERTFIYDSYANRKNKGTHKAIKRYQEFSKSNKYVLKCDIKKYFPSIDHEILKQLIRKKIACRDTLWLIDKIIDSSNKQEKVNDYYSGDTLFTPFERKKGLPIGNLTSQFFANIYLNGLDHFIKEHLRCKYYVRYVDDFVLFDNSKVRLSSIKKQITIYLENLRLILNLNKSIIYKVENGVEFLGHKVFPFFRLLKKQNIIRFKRKLKKLINNYKNGSVDKKNITQSVEGWEAHAKFSNTFRLRCKILSKYNSIITG